MNKVVYASKGGNTKKVAEAIAKEVGAPAVSVEQFDIGSGADILFIGASIYAGSIDGKLRVFLEGLKPELVKTAVVFSTSAGKKNALQEIRSILEPQGINVSDDVFYCKGSFLFAHRGHPNEEDINSAEEFARNICGAHA